MQNKRRFEQYHRYGLLFIAPFFLAFLVFQLYPILYTIYLSFTDLKGWNPAANLVGLDNYFAIFRNPLFLKSISNTFILWGVNFVPQIGLALLLAAWFTNIKLRLRGKGFFKVVFYLPNIITAASVAILFFVLFSFPLGPINLV
ncbi:sugar ABC transporter permease, partial [Listeria monocytogenes]|nr:sugar ABC transporter permease [Listeria monocytogenes]